MKTMSYKLRFIDNRRFMASSLSTFANNLDEGIYKTKCRYGQDSKKCKTYRIKQKDYEFCLEQKNIKNDLIPYKCLCCNKNCQKTLSKS